MTDTHETLELGFVESARSPAGYWGVRVARDGVEVSYTPGVSNSGANPPVREVTTLRRLLEHPPERLQQDPVVCAAVYRALVSRAGATAHTFRSEVVFKGVTSRLHAVVEGDLLRWTEEGDRGAPSAGQVAVTGLKSFFPKPPVSYHLNLWRRLARLVDVLTLPPEEACPADEAAFRRSPTFSVGYTRDGRTYRTELYANPRRAYVEVGPAHGTARSHEGMGFDMPLPTLLGAGGSTDTHGEPSDVMASLTRQLREWVDARVDPHWK